MPSSEAAVVRGTGAAWLLTAATVVVVATFVVLLLVSPGFGPNDDHRFIETIQKGKALPFYITPQEGRFYPLVAEEYWLLSKVSPSVRLYYAYNAAQLVGFVLLLGWILEQATASRTARNLAILAALLAPGFAAAWFRLHVPERDVQFFLALFFAAWLALGRNPGSWAWLAAGGVAAVVALFYKEPVFVLLACFVGTALLSGRRSLSTGQKRLAAVALVGCVGFVGVYCVAILPHVGPNRYGATSLGLPAFVLQALPFAAINNPVLLLTAAPMLVFRAWRLGTGRDRWDPLYDSMFAASVAYAGVFVALRMDVSYYLLPCYVCALPPLAHWLTLPAMSMWRRVMLAATVLVAATVGSTTAARGISDAKYWPINLNGAIDEIAARVTSPKAAPSRRVVLFDVKPDAGLEMLVTFSVFLHSRGVRGDAVCITSSGRIGEEVLRQDSMPLEPFYGCPSCGDQARPGDFVVVIPYMSHVVNYKALFDWLGRRAKLLYRSHSPLAFPNLLRFLKDWRNGGVGWRDLFSSPAYSPDFFVFEMT